GKRIYSRYNLKRENITINVRKKVRSVTTKDVKSRFGDIGSSSRSLIISSIRKYRLKGRVGVRSAIRSQPGLLNKNNICCTISVVKERGQYFISLCTVVLYDGDWFAFHKEWEGLSVVGSSGFLTKFLYTSHLRSVAL